MSKDVNENYLDEINLNQQVENHKIEFNDEIEKLNILYGNLTFDNEVDYCNKIYNTLWYFIDRITESYKLYCPNPYIGTIDREKKINDYLQLRQNMKSKCDEITTEKLSHVKF